MKYCIIDKKLIGVLVTPRTSTTKVQESNARLTKKF